MSKLADLIWKNAELLRGAFKENEYRKVILPFTILRRLDCVLQSTREAVWARHAAVQGKGYDLDKMLTPVSGYPFFNTSKFTLPNIAETPDDVRDNLEAMINGFSQNVRDIFEKFGFTATLDKLAEKTASTLWCNALPKRLWVSMKSPTTTWAKRLKNCCASSTTCPPPVSNTRRAM